MTDTDYEPSPSAWVRNQVEAFESSNGQSGNTLLDTGWPIIVLTMVGNKTGKIRKVPLMRVEHDGEYVAVASKGGAPENPVWYHNIIAVPSLELQDGDQKTTMSIREITGEEKATWWTRAVAAYPPYAEYQEKTDRQIPVFLLSPVK